jgi:hypothetical protein
LEEYSHFCVCHKDATFKNHESAKKGFYYIFYDLLGYFDKMQGYIHTKRNIISQKNYKLISDFDESL